MIINIYRPTIILVRRQNTVAISLEIVRESDIGDTAYITLHTLVMYRN